MSVLTYAKEHPWATGIIVVIGGIIFIAVVRGSGGSNGSSGADAGPSDAEILADAQVRTAQIAAQASASQAGAAVQAAQIGAGVQLNSDNQAAAVMMRQIEASEKLGVETVLAQERAVTGQINMQQNRFNSIIGSLGSLKKNNRDDVLQALITGQPFNQRSSDGASSIISSIGGAVSSIGALFSDARLKENIQHIGFDAKGRDVYSYNYKGSKTRRQGFIAQSIKRSEPDRVIEHVSGYMKVNYNGQ